MMNHSMLVKNTTVSGHLILQLLAALAPTVHLDGQVFFLTLDHFFLTLPLFFDLGSLFLTLDHFF